MEEREAAVSAVQELDFDYATGKLAEADYQVLRAGYERRALVLLKAVDAAASADTAQAGAPLDAGRAASAAEPRTSERPGGVPGTPAAAVARRNGAAARPSAPGSYVVRPGARGGPPLPPQFWGGGKERGGGAARGRRAVVLAGAVAVAFLAGVVGVYVVGSRGQTAQRPVAVLEGIGPRALALAPADARVAFLASAAGLWTSADGGSAWQPVETLVASVAAVRAVATSPARPERVYAAGPGRLARSDDGGRRWTLLPLALPADGAASGVADLRALAVDPANAERLWAVLEGAGVFRSDDGGATWVRTSGEAPANATALTVVSDPAAGPLLLYLASATEGVLASGDEGRGWAPASGALSGALPTRRVSSLAFDAASGDTATTPDGRTLRGTLYAGTDEGVFRSIDRGQSWGRLPLAASVAAVAAGGEPGSGLVLAADREGRVYRSRSRGVTWDGS